MENIVTKPWPSRNAQFSAKTGTRGVFHPNLTYWIPALVRRRWKTTCCALAAV